MYSKIPKILGQSKLPKVNLRSSQKCDIVELMNTQPVSTNAYSRIEGRRINTIRNLRPETLSRALEAFENGRPAAAARIFEAILARDDAICGLNLKRKKSISRLDFEIVPLEDSPKAVQHQRTLKNFYSTLQAGSYDDLDKKGGLRLLISQMMDCVGMKYSVHKVEFQNDNGIVKGIFTQYPLWLFENTQKRLRILDREGQLTDGRELDPDEWLIACGDGLMFASSIAYLFKQLPLKDWLIYCERNGMPGIKAKTDAFPGTPQWENVCEAVREFGAEFHAVFSEGTEMDAIDVSTRGELPYPALIERVDRMMSALWRGSDLSTFSAADSVGASMQWYEETLIEEDDASNIAETLNRKIDALVIKLAHGDPVPLAKFRLKLPDYEERKHELEIIERLCAIGLKPDPLELARQFAFPLSETHSETKATQTQDDPKKNEI